MQVSLWLVPKTSKKETPQARPLQTSLATVTSAVYGVQLTPIFVMTIEKPADNTKISKCTFTTALRTVRFSVLELHQTLIVFKLTETSYIRSVVFIKNVGSSTQRVNLFGDWYMYSYPARISPLNSGRYYTRYVLSSPEDSHKYCYMKGSRGKKRTAGRMEIIPLHLTMVLYLRFMPLVRTRNVFTCICSG